MTLVLWSHLWLCWGQRGCGEERVSTLDSSRLRSISGRTHARAQSTTELIVNEWRNEWTKRGVIVLKMAVTAILDVTFCADTKYTSCFFFGILQNRNTYIFLLESQNQFLRTKEDNIPLTCILWSLLNTTCVHHRRVSPDSTCPLQNHNDAGFFAQHSFSETEKASVSLSQRSRLASLSRWFFRSWKTSVKKCGSAFSCSILALILLMMRSDVSQKASLFASIMNGLSG